MDKQPDLIVDPDDTATFFYQSGTYTPDQSIGFLMRRVLSSILQAADAQLAEQVFLATDARKRMAELGFTAPAANSRKHMIMGREFDPAQPEAYLKGFAIQRSA